MMVQLFYYSYSIRISAQSSYSTGNIVQLNIAIFMGTQYSTVECFSVKFPPLDFLLLMRNVKSMYYHLLAPRRAMAGAFFYLSAIGAKGKVAEGVFLT